MDGVTILNEMSVRGENLGFVIIWILLTIACIVMRIWDDIDNWPYVGWGSRMFGIICTLMIGVLTSMVAVGLVFEYNTFHTEYMVTINDSVGFNEFNSRYEIVSQDGDVYTVIEKDVQ